MSTCLALTLTKERAGTFLLSYSQTKDIWICARQSLQSDLCNQQTRISLYCHPVCQGFSFTPLFWIARRLQKAHAISEGSYLNFGFPQNTALSMQLNCTLIKAVCKLLESLQMVLTLLLLNPDMSCLCKHCRSRSVGFWRSQLIWICTVCH